MTQILIAAIAMFLGAVMGLGIALKVFGVDTECQRRIHQAWTEGFVAAWHEERGRSVENGPHPTPAFLVDELAEDNPYPSGDPRE